MGRIVRMHNVSEADILLADSVSGQVTVPAFGFTSLPYDRYIRLSIDNDLNDFRLRVDIAQETVKKASVTDFGAKGDGLTNDTYAMQRAIDYIIDYGGGIVDIPVGVYVIDGLSVAGNVVIQGESREDSVLKMRGSGTAIAFDDSDGGADKVRLIGPSDSGYSVGISVNNSAPLSITNCSITNVNECMRLSGGSQLVVENCYMSPKRYEQENLRFYVFEGNDSSITESFCSYE